MRERDLVVRGGDAVPARAAPDQRGRGVRIAAARIAVVTHGQASDPFWAIVKRGVTTPRQQTDVAGLLPRARPLLRSQRMRQLIDEAVADHPDGLVVSLPDARALAPGDPRAPCAPGSRS